MYSSRRSEPVRDMENAFKMRGKSRKEGRKEHVPVNLAFQLWLPIIPYLIRCHNRPD